MLSAPEKQQYKSVLKLLTKRWNIISTSVFFFPQDDTIETKRACVLKSLCIYLNEDPDKLFKDYMVSYTMFD